MDSSEEKFSWTQQLTMKLIQEVERRPCIWSRADGDYSNKTMKAIAFDEIGEILNVPSANVREKFRNLRINFMQVHKKKLSAGSRANYVPKWEFYNALLYMADTCVASSISSASSTTSKSTKRRKLRDYKTNTQDTPITTDPLFDDCNSSQTTQFSHDKESRSKFVEYVTPFKRTTDNLSETEMPVKRTADKFGECIETPRSSHVKFGEYIAFSLENLDDTQLVKKTKAKIQLIISEAIRERAMAELALCESSAEF
ncbi:PREDICTED: uncharacterized protein LOC108977775 [Bactrocera latifrons]|uniref:MADF domain-containing protein n=1 Tax=Bactrocera latifrons TaxID=174628 RepID=A0A0K8VZ77_BACLA|nr:PREDICTED: uncharacterized protein LOC108977775 [Bactrocera latifrons]